MNLFKWIVYFTLKILFLVSKINDNVRSLPPIKVLIIFIIGWFSYLLIALKTVLVRSELPVLLARVLSISISFAQA